MKKAFLFFILLFSTSFYAQTIEMLQKGDTLQKPTYQQFIYLCDSTDISAAKFVAKIKATGNLKHTTNLYYYIKDKAQSMGANGFRFESFQMTDSKTGELILSAYYCEDDLFEANFQYIPKNKIFVFGDDDWADSKSQGFKVQGNKYEVSSGRFRVFDIKENDEIKINKGGFTGMTMWYKRKEHGYSSFISFSGLGLNGATYQPGYNGVGVSFNTGKIDRVEPNLALCLLKIYKEQQ